MNKTYQQSKNLSIFSAGLAILISVLISLFNHWEPGGETWGYWFFARIFAQTGKFIVFDRSPLYTLYLNLFRWLGYPNSVTVEYIITSCIVIISLSVLFRKYLDLGLAVFASLLWLPFLQIVEPPVQKLALACSCLAIAARNTTNQNKFYFVLSYALLGLAYLFRLTYSLMIIVFIIWDVFKFIKYKGVRSLISELRPRLIYWPVIIVIMLFVFFSLNQSLHPWNNTSVSSVKWFLNKSKSLSQASFIHSMNFLVAEDKYSNLEGKDLYFTNEEFFGGASSVSQMIKANPKLVVGALLKNIKNLATIALSPTDIFKIYLKLPLRGYFMDFLKLLLAILLFASIINGALRATKDESMVLFIIANTALICATVLSIPKIRYTVSLIPVFILSAFYYGVKLRDKIVKWSESFVSKMIKQWLSSLSFLCVPAAIMIFSNGASSWVHIATGLTNDLIRKETKVLQTPDYIKGSFMQINKLVQDCNGVMALENTFIGAFTDIPLEKVYDVWEIPPFGKLGNSVYNGLTPERLNCLLVSSELKTGVGFPTNYQIRYQNYIKPYVEKLKNLGAHTYKLGKFGEMVILKNPGKN